MSNVFLPILNCTNCPMCQKELRFVANSKIIDCRDAEHRFYAKMDKSPIYAFYYFIDQNDYCFDFKMNDIDGKIDYNTLRFWFRKSTPLASFQDWVNMCELPAFPLSDFAHRDKILQKIQTLLNFS